MPDTDTTRDPQTLIARTHDFDARTTKAEEVGRRTARAWLTARTCDDERQRAALCRDDERPLPRLAR